MRNCIRGFYKFIVPKNCRDFIGKRFDSLFNRDSVVCLGALHPKRKFYIIRIAGENWGCISAWINLMPFVLYALKKKYIPIIDMKNVIQPKLMAFSNNKGGGNCWELYFKQPQIDFSLDDILHSTRVVFASWRNVNLKHYENIRLCNLPPRHREFVKLKKMYDVCPLSDDIISLAEKLKNVLFPKNKKILAVSFRRAFEWCHYNNLDFTPPGSHLIRGDLFSVFSEIRKFLVENEYDFFFFMVDDREALDLAIEEFGDSCIYFERCMPHYFFKGEPVSKNDYDAIHIEFGKRENDVYLNAKEYLAGVYLMSRCDSFLSCGGSADVLAFIMNNKKFEKFIQLEGKGDSEKHTTGRKV